MTLWGAGGGGESPNFHLNCFGFLNSDFNAFGSKKSSLREQDLALNDTFFLFHFKVQSLEVLKTVFYKFKMSQGGGGSENCHVLFEWLAPKLCRLKNWAQSLKKTVRCIVRCLTLSRYRL